MKIRIIINKVLQGTFVCVFLFISELAAQDCSANLDQAKASYRIGKLYEIPGIMEGCLGNGELSRQQEVEAYELLSITYLYIDEPELAEKSYLNLLNADPEYQPDSIIEVEIDFLSKKFKTTPIFTLSPAKIGTNVSFPRVINVNGTDNTSSSMESYQPLWGVQLGGGVDWNISQKLSLGAETFFGFSEFRYANNFFDADSLQLDESHLGIEIPFFIRYTHRVKNKWYPFVYGGYSLSYLIRSTANPNFFEVNQILDSLGQVEDRIINQDFGRNLDLTKIRRQLNHNLFIGLGVKYRLEYEYISFDVRYTLGLRNVLDTKDQFDFGEGGSQNDIRELVFKYGQVDNDFRLDKLTVNFGFVHPLYKPRKIQKRSLKGILGRLFNKNEESEDQ